MCDVVSSAADAAASDGSRPPLYPLPCPFSFLLSAKWRMKHWQRTQALSTSLFPSGVMPSLSATVWALGFTSSVVSAFCRNPFSFSL